MRGTFIRVCAGSALLVGVTLVAPPATAYPRAGNRCAVYGQDYELVPDSRWNRMYRQPDGGYEYAHYYARAGIRSWRTPLDFDGSRLAWPTENWDGPHWRIYFDSTPGGKSSRLGNADCGNGTIAINPIMLDSPARLQNIVAHEFGHALGLRHTGEYDSFDRSKPLMSTCNEWYAWRRLTQDDAGNLTHRLSSLTPRALHPNSSFEQGFSYWGRFADEPSDPPPVSIQTDGVAADGVSHLRYRNSRNEDHVYQTVAYSASSGTDIDGRINYRLDNYTSGARYGRIYFDLLVRRVRYGTVHDSQACEYQNYPSGQDDNYRASVGGWFVANNQYVTPTGSWALKDIPEFAIPQNDLYKSFDVRLRIRSEVKDSGGRFAYVLLDNNRGRDKS